MLFTSFEEVWDIYCRSAGRLPPYPAVISPKRVSGLADILEHYQVIAFDAYGVLHNGGDAFPTALKAVAEARRAGRALCVVTNDVTHQPERVAEGLRRRGFDFAPDEVVSGRTLLGPLLRRVQKPEQTFGLISSSPAEVCAALPEHRLQVLGRDLAAYDRVDGILFIDNNDWEQSDADIFSDSLTRIPRPLVVCNPDVGCPFWGKYRLSLGFMLIRLPKRQGLRPCSWASPLRAFIMRFLSVSRR